MHENIGRSAPASSALRRFLAVPLNPKPFQPCPACSTALLASKSIAVHFHDSYAMVRSGLPAAPATAARKPSEFVAGEREDAQPGLSLAEKECLATDGAACAAATEEVLVEEPVEKDADEILLTEVSIGPSA